MKTRSPNLSSAVQDAQVEPSLIPWSKLYRNRPFTPCPVWCVVLTPPPPDDQPRIPAGLRASAKACRYNGTIYQPGETFNKHDLFPSKQSNQCVMCTCSVSYTSFVSLCFFFLYFKSGHSGGRISDPIYKSILSNQVYNFFILKEIRCYIDNKMEQKQNDVSKTHQAEIQCTVI